MCCCSLLSAAVPVDSAPGDDPSSVRVDDTSGDGLSSEPASSSSSEQLDDTSGSESLTVPGLSKKLTLTRDLIDSYQHNGY